MLLCHKTEEKSGVAKMTLFVHFKKNQHGAATLHSRLLFRLRLNKSKTWSIFFSDDKGLTAFLMQLYSEKDELKENFLKTGSFSAEGKFPVHRAVNLRRRLPVLVRNAFYNVISILFEEKSVCEILSVCCSSTQTAKFEPPCVWFLSSINVEISDQYSCPQYLDQRPPRRQNRVHGRVRIYCSGFFLSF